MSLHHSALGEVIDIKPLGTRLSEAASVALVRTDDLEVMRMVLLKGKSIPEHHVTGGLIVQCIEGTVELQVEDRQLLLQAGQLVFIREQTPYAMRALEDAFLLTTILRKPQEGTV